MVRPTVNDGRFMMGEHRVPPASLAEKRRLNALASRGGGDRSAIAKVAKKQKGASLATAYAHRYADVIADHELSALLQQNSFDDHEELVTVGTRVGVPSSHPNKYGYATTAVVVNVSGRGRCLLRLDITHEERWEPSKLVQKWIVQGRRELACKTPPPPDVNSLAGALATSTLDHMSMTP
uniref:Uncharacterized protein n=1 Tax=Phaeocystis antarctica TaxID=33657 RepID=A0A7S0HQA6_9EUKA|mmetsp:Transcript_28035/g.66223  ORF Transcript_28035/g.66223 Transcript_28035/m.66223 type:complete len:180 (+) Transcript_28035:64-603(+)